LSAPQTSPELIDAGPAELLEQAKGLIQSARFHDAEALLEDLLSREPEHEDTVEALYMQAVARRYAGQLDAALAALEALLEEEPDYARAYQERGHALLALGQADGAAAAYNRAVELNPALTASWQALAKLHTQAKRVNEAQLANKQLAFLQRLPRELVSVTSYIHEGKLHKAERLCRQFLQQNKHHVEGMRLLAEIGTQLRIYDDAEFLLESCMEFAPDYTRARIDYMNVLVKKTKFEQAHEQARRLITEQPHNPRIQTALATTYVGLGRYEEGIALYRRVLEKHPANHELHVLLGHAQKTVGDTEAAIASYQRAYAIKPDFGDAFWSLANIKTYAFTDEEVAQLKRVEAAAGVSADDRVHLCFAAGKALEDRGEHDASFKYYERGNRLRREQLRYNPAANERKVQAQIDTCTAELFERHAGAGCPAPDPIFIVGLPRAGSTLLEQILASHSMVDGTMELHNILHLAQRLRGRTAERSSRYPGILHELDPDYFRRFGEQYIENTRVYRAGAPRFVDKMPNNFFHIGLIRLILPNAKVIDARREPLACCFSGFKQLFGEGQDFTYGLREIGSYYRDYVRLMDHWDEVLPGFVLRVMHEDVVEDLEGQVRRILDFCGLPFQERCLRYYETERSIRTPSAEQVRRPIYSSGVAQWRRYESHLGPLKEALGPEILARYPPRPDAGD